MKLLSPLPPRKARIEIIPLIDIMFFLLACMMLVSLNLSQLRGIKVNLPVSVTDSPDTKPDFVTVSIRKDGVLFVDKLETPRPALVTSIQNRVGSTPEPRVMIQGDTEAMHGDVIAVLDLLRKAGFQKVTFQTNRDSRAGGILETPDESKPPR